jgi:hypothetical protein
MIMTHSSRNEADTATNMSMATMPIASLRRKLRHVGEGVPTRSAMYFATVAWLIFNAELRELAVDAGRTPQWVGAVHLPDQITNFAIYRDSCAARALQIRFRGQIPN